MISTPAVTMPAPLTRSLPAATREAAAVEEAEEDSPELLEAQAQTEDAAVVVVEVEVETSPEATRESTPSSKAWSRWPICQSISQ